MTTGADPAPLSLAVLISGRGSNMVSIAQACGSGAIPARVAAVIADVPEAAGLARARALGLVTEVVDRRACGDRPAFEAALAACFERHAPGLIVLAGFMRILSAGFVSDRLGRMLNIHPSLLPRYPGLHTHARVLAAGDAVHGASVHYVTPELDGGPVILQSRVRVMEGEDEARLTLRVQSTEHVIYPRVIGWIGSGRLHWNDGAPMLDGRPLSAPVIEEFE